MPSEKMTLPILAAVLIVLAFVLRAIAPRNVSLPGGWPFGTRWYPLGWVLFRAFLGAGIILGAIVILKAMLRGQKLGS